MSTFTVCARFRPLSSRERRDYGDSVCIHSFDDENFSLKDEREGEFKFSFDKVFYEKSEQLDVYTFLAWPIVRDAVNGINGTIITYGQTGAGKTYSMEGPNILELDEHKKGLLPRVIAGIFEDVSSCEESIKFTIKLSMVEIYMEKVRDLFDLSKDNVQIKENKSQGILLFGATDVTLKDPVGALQILQNGIANRAVGETHIEMNMASSRSHCVYIITIQQETTKDKRTKCGKLVLVDLAGSEKVEKTGAEGKVLEEAKTINKSLSALGNVVYAVTCGGPGKANHIPYRDSKLTRILQDALGGSCRAALLCCCSPSTYNASETLSTLRFGARAKHIKASPCVSSSFEDNKPSKVLTESSPTKDITCERILDKLRAQLRAEDVKLLEELFILEGIIVDLNSIEDLESDCQDVTERTISSLIKTVEELESVVVQLKSENEILLRRLEAVENGVQAIGENVERPAGLLQRILNLIWFLLW